MAYSMQKNFFHKSVMVAEVIQYLDLKPEGIYIDATFGAGGHSRALLEQDKTIKVIALDWDESSIEKFAYPMQEEFGDRFTIMWGNFGNLYKLIKKLKITEVDGILADFGTSQMQLAEGEGFSFAYDSELDMRMSPSHYKITAALVVNESSEKTLRDIFWHLGEERFAKQIAHAIVEERKKEAITTTRKLADLISKVKPRTTKKNLHPATKVFQALRIYVNKELENIEAFLPAALSLLKPQARLVCISFHSLEDRLVKNFLREQYQKGNINIVTKKVVIPSQEEVYNNRSSRSAKLRAGEKINNLQENECF